MKKLLDTNAILRYLLNDIPEQASKTEQMIKSGAFTLPEIIAEVVYVLVKVYSVPKIKIREIVAPIFEEIEIQNKDVIIDSLQKYSNTSFDFVDCILISRSMILGDEIFTFDKKLNNCINGISKN